MITTSQTRDYNEGVKDQRPKITRLIKSGDNGRPEEDFTLSHILRFLTYIV